MERKKLLIADDSEMSRAILASMLEDDFDIAEAVDGREAIDMLENYGRDFSALLLDVVMPEMNGFEVLEEMNRRNWIDKIPTIMISAETSNAYIDRAYELGASDYISRPFAAGIIRHRVINTILLHSKQKQLTDVVNTWFYNQEKNYETVVSILDYAIEHRGGESGVHMYGVKRVTTLLTDCLLKKTNKYILSTSDANAVCMASGLHDVGKIFIPEHILKKPDSLTAEEIKIMEQHTVLGAQMIEEMSNFESEKLAKYAAEICRFHHERWDGGGYPCGLAGDDIPISAQIVSVADAYDSLTHERCYKKAYSHELAMKMILSGECGAFNPILLECLKDIATLLKPSPQDQDEKKDAEGKRIYSTQNVIASRVIQQFENKNTKLDFMINMSDELWFEYTLRPSNLRLSKGVTERTGLATVISNPLEDTDCLGVIGQDTFEEISKKLSELTTDDSYTELTVKLVLNGKLCRCKLAILVLWSSVDSGKISNILGRAIDIDENYSRLELYDESAASCPKDQVLLPLLSDGDGVVKITSDRVGQVLQSYRNMFDIVRLVDPGICMQISADGHGVNDSEKCYSVWNKVRRCDNCISQDTVRSRRPQTKIETIGADIYFIVASCIEVDGIPYSLECVRKINADIKNASDDNNILNQLLLRNRQVYMDSITKVFNRRYYDTRIKNISGEHALAMIDMDNLKQINDNFGHRAGDEALYRTAQAISSVLRSNDELIRYGGDEFFLLFNGLPEKTLAQKLDRLCEAARNIVMTEYPELRITLSIGGYFGSGRICDIIEYADRALYMAKKHRDCAVVYKDEDR